jgi:hypothetical protein
MLAGILVLCRQTDGRQTAEHLEYATTEGPTTTLEECPEAIQKDKQN